MLRREPGIGRTVFESQFTGPDRPVFTEVSREKLIWAGTLRLGRSLNGFAAPLGGVRCLLSRKGFSRSK